MQATPQKLSGGSGAKVSVVIPAYNTAHLIGKCLDSVFAQSFEDFEAIVVNDGSPDTPELEKTLRPYLDRIAYIRQENKRAAGARNTAIRAAQGEFLAFLDSDDTWLPHHLSNQMQLFADDPSLDLVYANGLLVGNHVRPGTTFMARCPSVGTATFESLVIEQCQISVSTVVARKSAIVRAGLFDESLLRCDDYDMWVRAAFYGAKIGYGRTVQACLDMGRPGSLGQSEVKMAEAYWTILNKLDRTLPLDARARGAVRERMVVVRAMQRNLEGKLFLAEHKFDAARQALAEANEHFHSLKLTLALAALRWAPKTTASLVSLWTRIQEQRAR